MKRLPYLFLFIALPACVSWYHRARIEADRSACAAHMTRIYKALQDQVERQRGSWPDLTRSTDWLQGLYQAELLSDPRVALCPGSGTLPAAGLGPSVHLAMESVDFGGPVALGASMQDSRPLLGGYTLPAPANTPILWDLRPRHYGARNVLFLDGHLETLLESDFQARFAEQMKRPVPVEAPARAESNGEGK